MKDPTGHREEVNRGLNSAAIFNDNNENQIEAGEANPWVQIDFGEGNQATIGDVDVYGNLENQHKGCLALLETQCRATTACTGRSGAKCLMWDTLKVLAA